MNSKPRHILLVEDHADSAVALGRLLQHFGHRVQTADCCSAAKTLFKSDGFDVVLVDLGLPDGDGCDLLRELTAIRQIPAIAITGFGMAEDIKRSKAAGFLAHLTKPFIVPELTQILSELKFEPIN
jgi:CheY-like chemotaxis protein